MAWFSTGEKAEENLKKEVKRQDEARKERAKTYTRRWWIPPTDGDDGSFLTFLDGETHPAGFKTPFQVTEHQLFRNGSWRNWYTCIDGEPDPKTGKPMKCPLCESGDKPYLADVYTIINEQEWTGKKGDVHKDEVNLFVCKTAVAKIIGKHRRKKSGLRGWRAEVLRSSSDAPNTGDSFEFDSEVRKLPDDLQPLNYIEILAPKTREELQDVVSGKSVDTNTPEANDDQVRF